MADERISDQLIEELSVYLANVSHKKVSGAPEMLKLLAEIKYYRAQIAAQKSVELLNVHGRKGLTDKIEMLARALATATLRYGSVNENRRSINIPLPVFAILDRGFRAIREANELGIERTLRELQALPPPEEYVTHEVDTSTRH